MDFFPDARGGENSLVTGDRGDDGQQGAAREVLAALERQSRKRHVPAFNLALVYAGQGEKDRALDALEKAYEDRDVHMMFLKVDPRWDEYRNDPRFMQLMRRMRLDS